MHIGIDCRMFNLRFGIGRYTHELVAHIARLNNELKNPNQITLFFNDPEYTEFQTPPNTQKILVNASHYSYKEQTTFLKKLNEQNCDIVHFPHFNIPIFYNKPYIVTIHDLIISLYPEKKIRKFHKHLAYKLAIKNAVKKAKKIITVSQNTKNDLEKFLRVPPEKITVIYPGVNPNFSRSKNPQVTLDKFHINKPFLLHAGVWRRHKNAESLVAAFKKIKEKADLQLVFTSPPQQKYRDTDPDIIFTDKVTENELIDLYSAAAVFVFPSLYEGFGLPPLEAMACGTPVVISNCTSLQEICSQDNAVFFNPENPQDIADKVLMLYKDEGLKQRLIKNGLDHVKKFSWADMAQKTFNIITGV